MLARTFGVTHAELDEILSAEEYGYWLAYYALDPWDEFRADLRQAYTSAMLAWVHGNKNTKVDDFIPFKPEEHKHGISNTELFTFIDAVNG